MMVYIKFKDRKSIPKETRRQAAITIWYMTKWISDQGNNLPSIQYNAQNINSNLGETQLENRNP